MKLVNILQNKIGWLEVNAQNSEIAISSRIRLARNLKDFPFPSRANIEQQKEIFKQVVNATKKSNYLSNSLVIALDEIDPLDRELLMERHLISYQHAQGDGRRGVIIGDKELLSIMINEEDHLRIQIMQPGFQLPQTWQIADKIDDEIASNLTYAFSSKLGYLTACPTNTGTGMRCSVLLHLPALKLVGRLQEVLGNLNKLGIVVRGLYGEGTRVMGDLYQISNQITLGVSEEWIVERLNKIIGQVIEYEQKAREEIYNEDRLKIEDIIYRAYGILSNVRKINFSEAMELISYLRLGVCLKIPLGVNLYNLNCLLINIQSAHLQEQQKKELLPNERDMVRAELIRQVIGGKEKNVR